jgi:tetratricopeptide (TPR) repeat protein
MVDIKNPQLFSALPIRALFQAYRFKPSHVLSMIASETVYGSQAGTLSARSRSFLTHSTAVSEQIRFPLRDRVERMLTTLAEDFKTQFGTPSLQTVPVNTNDFLTNFFFQKLGAIEDSVHGTHLSWDEALLSAKELHIQTELQKEEPDLTELVSFARSRIYSCDYQTALRVLEQIPAGHGRSDLHHLKGLCYNFFSQTVQAENEFLKMMECGSTQVQANAGYVLSMLYLRLHPKELQSLTKAEEFLQNAYQKLMQESLNEDIHFLRIFNRNGYALCLYRRGRVIEAVRLLEAGIADLKKIGNHAYDLHQSVLLYNALQCYRTLEDYKSCEAVTVELLSLDPLFPEYHLEHGKTLLEQNKIEMARASFQKAIELDALIPEAHALLGYSFVVEGDYRSAFCAYETALSLKPESEQFQNDLNYCQQEMETAS